MQSVAPVGTSTARPCILAPAPPFVILSGAMRSIAPVGTSIARPGIDAKAPCKNTKRNPRFRLRTFPITRPLPTRSFDSADFVCFAQDDNVCVYILSFRSQRGIPRTSLTRGVYSLQFRVMSSPEANAYRSNRAAICSLNAAEGSS